MGEVTLNTPRDRDGTFEPQIVGKHQRRVPGFDEKILALYAKGMTTRDIQEIVRELYGVDVSATLVSEITADLDAEVTAWQTRPIEAVWPIVYFDGIVVHVRGGNGRVSQHTIYVALGVNLEGKKELLGLWLDENEGAKFWLACLTDLKKIYQAATVLEAEQALDKFAQAWDAKYPTRAKQWRAKWTDIITLFDFPAPIRKAIYTTNAIESVNSVIRKFTRNRKIYPNEQSALKLVYMAIAEASKKWTRPIHHWKQALNHFAITYEDRMPKDLS